MLKNAINIVNKEFVKNLKPNYLLVDVRTAEEVKGGIIPNSKHLPVDLVADALKMSPAVFESVYKFKKPLKQDPVVFYCLKGSRAQLACKMAQELGYENLHNYAGSWTDWTSKS